MSTLILLHRAVINAGDFLIRDRMVALIRHHRPDVDVVTGRGWLPLRTEFRPDQLAGADAIAVCGGPGYQRSMYPDLYPLGPLDSLDVPVFLLALGSHAFAAEPDQVELGMETRDFLAWVRHGGGRLGARDRITAQMLDAQGFPGVPMTGDPAWYDLDQLERDDFDGRSGPVAFTPPANPLFFRQGLGLLEAVARESGPDNVIVTFHRRPQPTFVRAADAIGCRTHDITGSASGFSVYDDAAIHIGYRVHAHLYCLSRSTPSYLVTEDSRGIGMSETLGWLGVDGAAGRRGPAEAFAWRRLTRLASDSTTPTRLVGSTMARLARMPDIGPATIEQVLQDRSEGFPRHVAAKERIRASLPEMTSLLESLP